MFSLSVSDADAWSLLVRRSRSSWGPHVALPEEPSTNLGMGRCVCTTCGETDDGSLIVLTHCSANRDVIHIPVFVLICFVGCGWMVYITLTSELSVSPASLSILLTSSLSELEGPEETVRAYSLGVSICHREYRVHRRTYCHRF